MKKYHFIFVLLFSSWFVNAQKIGVVDTDYILSKLPQYQEAQKRLENQVKTWQDEISKMQTELDDKKAAFENEKVLLVGDQLKQKEKELQEMDKNLKDLLTKRFGGKGEINQARATISKPFQDEIWNAIKTISDKNGLGIVFDKSNNISVLFLNKTYDYTDKVLDFLNKTKTSSDKNSNKTKTGR